MSAPDSGPAFPCWESDSEGRPVHYETGMTLRDYFAAAALQGILASCANGIEKDGSLLVPTLAYAYADSMLRERAK